MKENLVTIIVPVYNVEKYMDKCVESIVNQTYKNLEIILVDDGSNDGSSEKCDEWEKKDKRIQVIHKQNGGLSDARNVGIKQSHGKYLSFVDSDDFIDNDMIEYLVDILEKNKAEISICGYTKFYENDMIEKDNRKDNVKLYTSKDALKLLLEDKKIQNYAWNKLYLKELFSEDCLYPYGRKMEDIGTTYLLFFNANTIALGNLSKYNYLQRKNSIVNCEDYKFIVDKFELSKERFRNLLKRNIFFIENYLDYTCKFLEIYRKKDNRIREYIRKNNVIHDYLEDVDNFKMKIFFRSSLKNKIKLLLFCLEEKDEVFKRSNKTN